MKPENIDIGLKVAEIFKLYGHARIYSPGEIIFQKGDAADKLYFLSKGRVRTYCLNKNGDELTLFYVDEEHLIGNEPLANISIRKVSVDAITDVMLYSLDAATLMEECVKNKMSMQNLMKFFITKIIMLSDNICCNRFMKNDEKLAYFLYTNCISNECVIHYTHEQIAAITGMNRVSVTRTLNSFAEKKLISQHYKEIIILNKNGLSDIFNSIGYFLD